MKRNHKLIGILTVGLLLLAACENSSTESSGQTEGDEPQQEENEAESENVASGEEDAEKDKDDSVDESNQADMTESAQEKAEETTENEETANDASEKEEDDTDSSNTASMKQEYIQKIEDAEKKTSEARGEVADGITIELKSVEGNLFDLWDGLLNEIYGVLEDQLPAEEMEQLRAEQREWIKYRDSTAKEASLEYEGGTAEQLVYTTVLNDLTAERCRELVEGYMK